MGAMIHRSAPLFFFCQFFGFFYFPCLLAEGTG